MPEGDTLWRTAAALGDRIQGRELKAVKPESFRRLVGHKVVAVEPRGKHLFIRFDSGLSLHSHLRMHGSWHVYRPGDRWQRPEHLAKCVLTFDGWVAVAFQAPVVEIVAGDERVAHLGPDILGASFDVSDVIRRVREGRDREVGETLLNQRLCAGIGNIYRCESLFAQRIDPWTSTHDISDGDLEQLYLTARRLMLESALGRSAPRRNMVHGRGSRPCRRCHHLIRVEPQGELARLTYWCPNCQGQGFGVTDGT